MPRVGELMSVLRNRRTTAARFRFNMSEQDALDLLTAHYMFEVESRHKKVQLDVNTIGNLRQMAHYITKPNPKFGVMLCGTCGNGKTTLMFALRSTIAFLKDRGHFDKYRNQASPYFDFELKFVDARDVIEIYKDRTRYADLRSERLLALMTSAKSRQRCWTTAMSPTLWLTCWSIAIFTRSSLVSRQTLTASKSVRNMAPE